MIKCKIIEDCKVAFDCRTTSIFSKGDKVELPEEKVYILIDLGFAVKVKSVKPKEEKIVSEKETKVIEDKKKKIVE